jgi:hypothetical protein
MHSTIEKSHSQTKVTISLNMHRNKRVLAQRMHTFFLKTNNSVKSHKKQSSLVNSLFVLVEESTHRKRRQTEGARRKERVHGQMVLQFFVKRHSIVKSHNKHTSCELSLCIGRGIDMEKATKASRLELGWSLDGYFFLHEILIGLKSSYLAIHKDFPSEYS